MKRKNMLTALALVMIMLLSVGCSSKDSSYYYGDEVTKNTLVICIDCSYSAFTDPSDFTPSLNKITQEIKSACGIEQLAIKLIPGTGVERETTLQRMRTEIMAGGGPDVFLIRTVTGSFEFGYDDVLFNFPEKDMEAGLFLPLDEYMENNTRFTDWDAQTQVILNAGRNDEGQLIIPTTYTFPILVYPTSETKIKPSTELTMYDILENPETAELGAVLYSSLTRSDASGDRDITQKALYHALGKFADFKTEDMLFTEDELYDVITTMNSLQDAIEDNPNHYVETDASCDLMYHLGVSYFDTDMTLIPTYSIDGGVTASIRSYAAINRNTAFPDEAYSVIDYIMSEEAQCGSMLYCDFFLSGLPLQNDLGSEEKPLNASIVSSRYLDESYFNDLLEIKEQITDVNYEGKIDFTLSQLFREYHNKGEITRKDVASTYEKLERMIGE